MCKRTNTHYSTSFLTSGYLSPNLNGLFVTRGKDDIVSKRQFILGRQIEMVSLFLVLKQYTKQVFHSLGWHHDLMMLCPSPFTIHKKKKKGIPLQPIVQYTAVNKELLRTHSLMGFLEEIFFDWFFRDTSLCRRCFYVGGCCFYRAKRSFPICCKGKIGRSLSLAADKSMGMRPVIYNITSSYCVVLGPFLILIFNAACDIQLCNLTQASCCDVNAVKALITIQLGEMTHYWYPVHSAPLSQGKYSLQLKTKTHNAVLIITQLAH